MRVALYTNPVAGGWDPRDRNNLGGGEWAIVSLSKNLAALGIDVDVFMNPAPAVPFPVQELPDGPGTVAYLNYNDAKPGYDVAIHRKTPADAGRELSVAKILWTDQVLAFDARPFAQVIVASRFLERTIGTLTPQARNRLHRIPDGYDPALDEPHDLERDPLLVLSCSSPDRGLEPLVQDWERVLSAHPAARLEVGYGWDLFLACGGDPRLRDRIQEQIAKLGSQANVTIKRRTRSELLELYRTAGIWAYYCLGGEYFCQVAIAAQVGGCVPVVRPWGALHETVWSGLRVRDRESFRAALIDALRYERQAELRAEAQNRPERPSCARPWGQVAVDWLERLEQARAAGTGLVRGQMPRVEPPEEIQHLQVVPTTPPITQDPAGLTPNLVAPGIAQWLGSQNAQAPYVSPSLGFNFNRGGTPLPAPKRPADADVAVLGWELEDDERPIDEHLRALGLRDGMPVAAMFSFGDWRTGRRQRSLARADVDSILRGQDDLSLRIVNLDGRGNGVSVTLFKYRGEKLGTRNFGRMRRLSAPRQTLAACFITRNAEGQLLRALRSVQTVVDQVVILDNGSTDHTVSIADDWRGRTKIPTVIDAGGTTPRFCFDCNEEHPVGDLAAGHRLAGFEYPRNQSIALAETDWIMWLDSDEQLLQPHELEKYLRPNIFNGYAVGQHHFSVQPPGNLKIDYPVRVFRRTPTGREPRVIYAGPELDWPTYDPGIAERFTGIVHEHPGAPPTHIEGIAPVIVLSDIWIAHSGYYTEDARRGRFVRNWPLMVADRAKYPGRRLGRFLWMRDVHHHLKYLIQASKGVVTPDVAMLAEELCWLWRTHFIDKPDMFTQDALSFATVAGQCLQRGIDVKMRIELRKPEITGDESMVIEHDGRIEDYTQLVGMIWARHGEAKRWEGEYL
jgi:glycosyltransferase involved in cell wall biosynthesis